MKEPEPNQEQDLLEATTGDFLKAISSRSRQLESSRRLAEVDAIRSAFQGVPEESSSGATLIAALPQFPGFTVLEKVGQGGFGAVYRARDEKLDRQVALKLLLPRSPLDQQLRENILREARTLARVRHPNVLTVHAVLEHGDQIALVTEFVEGQSLADLVGAQGPLSASEAAQIGATLCRALAAVHASGLVHRDVKPANVLRERGGRLVLTDFGLGVLLGGGRAPEQLGFVAGSPLFMSPEQVRGDPVDPRTDVYALGVVLYHLSTGAYPVHPCPLPDLFARIRAGTLIPIRDARPDLPAEFAQVVTRAMALEPEDRYGTAGEMERALLSCLGTSPGERAPGGIRGAAMESPPQTLSRRTWFRLGAGALAAAAVLLLLLMQRPAADGFRIEEAALQVGSRSEPLREGEAIRVGDTLHLRFRADRDLHVYVLDEDAKGERYLLFPLASSRLRNPLPGGTRHRLPGTVDNREASWEVSSAGGTEWIIVVASPRPIPVLEALAPEARLPASGVAAAYPRLTPEAGGELLRGLGGLKLGEAPPGEPGELLLSRFVEELKDPQGSAGNTSGPWVRKFTLRNP